MSWSPYFTDAWWLMEFFAKAGQGIAAINTLCIPSEAAAAAPGFAAAFPNVRSVSAQPLNQGFGLLLAGRLQAASSATQLYMERWRRSMLTCRL